MVEFKININEKERQAYIPKTLIESLGHRWILRPNMKAAVVYSQETPIRAVRRSVEILLDDIRHQESLEEAEAPI